MVVAALAAAMHPPVPVPPIMFPAFWPHHRGFSQVAL